MMELMKIMYTSFKRSHACTSALSALTLQQATADPRLCRTLVGKSDSVSWGHSSLFLGPGSHKVLFVPSESLSPQSCVRSGGSMVGLMATFSKRVYVIPRSAAPVLISACLRWAKFR